MFNLQRYSSAVVFVLLFSIKALTGLPYGVQTNPIAQPQLDVGLPLAGISIPADGIQVEARSLNVSQSDPTLRSLPTVNVSVAAAVPVQRSLPSPSPATPLQQQADVAARSGFANEAPAAAAPGASVAPNPPQQRIDSVQVNASLSVQNPPAARSALEGLNANATSVEQRSLNTSGPLAASPHPASNTPVQLRSADVAAPAAGTVNISNNGNPFVPSFLRTFGFRQKRGEGVAETVSSNLQQKSAVKDTPQVAERIGLGKTVAVSSDNKAADPLTNVYVAPNDANVASRVEMVNQPASSFLNVPYINVYPRDTLEY